MGFSYKRLKSDNEAVRLMRDVMQEHHQDLHGAEVTVGMLAKWPGEDDVDDKPVLTLHGYACLATVKVTSLKDRVLGVEDAIITLDGREYEKLSDREQRALLDHELEHLVLVCDADGNIKADDHGRPKLKIKNHDWQLGGFIEVVERNGDASLERQAFQKWADGYRQLLLPWG